MLIIMKNYLVLENQLLFNKKKLFIVLNNQSPMMSMVRWHAPSGKKMCLNIDTFGDIEEFNYFEIGHGCLRIMI